MQKIEVLVGCPASGKSFYCQQLMKKEPGKWRRINNDALRLALDFGVYSTENEKTIRNARSFLIKECLSKGFNLIIDNVNAGKNFQDICKLAQESNVDVQVYEKVFFEELEVLLERDSKREGTAKVGEAVVKKWFKEFGGKQHKFYKPRTEIFIKRNKASERFVDAMVQDESLEKCAVFDLDGTMCDIRHRNPYDASNCDKDKPNQHVVDLAKLLYENGYKIFFFSGREDEHKEMTQAWLDKYFGYPYDLYMRETGNKEDDRLLKERLFNTHIKDKFNCKLWVDDRLRVCKFIHEAGLPLFRVGDPEASF